MEGKAKKPLSAVSAVIKMLAADKVQLSLVAALVMAFTHAGFAAYNLGGRPPCGSSS